MANPYFNATYYLANNPDIFAAGVTTATAWDHYVSYGAQEAYTAGGMTRAPNAWFDAQFYLQNNQDLIANGVTPETAFDHFTNFGMYELRAPSQSVAASPMTDASLLAYVNANADVAEALGVTVPATELTETQQNGAIANFYGYGYAENRPSAPTNVNANPTETFTLTTGADTASANFFDGSSIIGADARLQTLNNTDNLTGSGDNAKLYAELVGAPTVTPLALKNIATVDLELGFITGASTLNAVNADSIKSASFSNGAFGVTLNNLSTALSSLSITNQSAGVVAAQSLASAMSGTEDSIDVAVSNSAFGGLTLSAQTGTNGYETVNVVSSGAAANNFGGLTSVGTTTLNVTGEQNLTTGLLSNTIATVNAAEFTGNLNASVGNAAVTVTGGSGNDTVVFRAGEFNTSDVVDGGAGTNTIRAAYADVVGLTAANANVKSIQTLQVNTDSTATSGNDTIRADLFGDSLKTVVFGNGATAAGATNVVRFDSGTDLAVSYSNFLGTFGLAETFGALTVEANGTATTDTLILTLNGDNPTTQAVETSDITIGNVNLSSNNRAIENLNIVSNNAAATTGATDHVIGSITLPNTVGVIDAITVTGNSNLSIGAVTADKLDASGLTNNAGLTMTAAAVQATQITGSAGADTLRGSAAGDVIATGAGVDTVTAGGGADQVSLGAGVDTVNQAIGDGVAATAGPAAAAAIAAGTTITFAGGVDMVSNFTAGTNGDVLNLDAATAVGSALGLIDNGAGANWTAGNWFLSGNYNSGTGVFTVTNNGIGADTMIVQTNSATSSITAATADAVILIGVDSDDLVAANFI